jgi:hypothetical protein
MKNYVNLLPLSYRRHRLLRRLLIQWSLVWTGCIVIGAAACCLAWQRGQSLQQDANAAERSAAPLKHLVEEQATIRATLKEFETKGSVLGQVRSQWPMLSLLGAVSQSAGRCEGRLVVHHLGFERKDEQASEGKKSPEPGGAQKPVVEKNEVGGHVTIRGDATDNVAVAAFVVGLRESGLFRHVELKSCLRLPAAGHEIRAYLLECDI